ncbi:hypothetical protein IFM89_008533 [Coptis chinensis]|uniref:Uncharacterized protein n=1 Tax=Coptis chinensis TaxID=261450 RepID=A0A835I358_9MAGN|nr:hypothetical protein IFM89_008533 [Coptis chinensis]
MASEAKLEFLMALIGSHFSAEPLCEIRVVVVVSSAPTLSIEEFYVPALDKFSNDVSNTTILFGLKLHSCETTYIKTLNVTLYFGENPSVPVGFVSIPGFYQRSCKETVHRRETVTTVGLPWETAMREAFKGGTTVFQVHVETIVTAKWSFTARLIMLKGNVTVGDQGYMLKSSTSVQVSEFANKQELFAVFVFVFLGMSLRYCLEPPPRCLFRRNRPSKLKAQ